MVACPRSQNMSGARNRLSYLRRPCDYDKLWADWMDLAPAVVSQLLVPTKATLLAWWASEASREQLAGESAEVNLIAPNGTFRTHVIEVRLRATGRVVELRQLALCEAPNRNQQLANQVEEFLDACTGVPIVLRTKGFPKGRTAQVAPALRKLEAMGGLKLDLSDTEWHILQRAKDFAEQAAGSTRISELATRPAMADTADAAPTAAHRVAVVRLI